MTCGTDVEQKINGVIKYLPIGQEKLLEKDKAKRPLFGVSNYKKQTPKKRKGRHAKHYSKRIPRRKKSRGQG